MKRRLTVVLASALLMATAAGFIAYRLAAAQAGPRHVSTVRIVAAARDLETGWLIHEGDVRVVDWPAPGPKGAIAAKNKATDRSVISAIYQGEAVTENRLAPAGSGGGLAATIPAGMRACAVRVNDVVGVAGFVVPGTRVDVLITGAPPGEPNGTGSAVRTLLQNIEVLSAGTNIDKDKEGKPQPAQVVNLLVNPQQAEILSLAGNEARIQLVLRNPSDVGITRPPGSTTADLFGTPKSPRPPVRTAVPRAAPILQAAPVPAFRTIEVINGGQHTEAKFPEHQESR